MCAGSDVQVAMWMSCFCCTLKHGEGTVPKAHRGSQFMIYAQNKIGVAAMIELAIGTSCIRSMLLSSCHHCLL